jgi:hypothetical protein
MNSHGLRTRDAASWFDTLVDVSCIAYMGRVVAHTQNRMYGFNYAVSRVNTAMSDRNKHGLQLQFAWRRMQNDTGNQG